LAAHSEDHAREAEDRIRKGREEKGDEESVHRHRNAAVSYKRSAEHSSKASEHHQTAGEHDKKVRFGAI
jgi:hypothetical protein